MKQTTKIRAVLALAVLLISFVGLYACGEKDSGGEANQTVYYTVTFDANGGSAVESRKVADGGYVTEPSAPSRDGYVFNGWNDAQGKSWLFEYNKVTSDMTLTASWISAENVFGYRKVEGADEAVITEIKQKTDVIAVPSQIGGYRVTGIAEVTFAGLTSSEQEDVSEGVSEIILPATVTAVGDSAFRNSAGITITVKGALTSIGEGAFYNCDGLQEIALGEGLSELAADVFSGCTGLKTVCLPQSLTAIRENAFEGCQNLISVLLYGQVTVIEDSAFDDCNKLTLIYFGGTETQLDFLLTEGTAPMNEAWEDANKYLYAAEKPTEKTAYNGYWYWDGNGNVRIWQ